MLEFKNTSVTLPGGGQSEPFSLVVGEGEVVCLCGGHGSGKSGVMRAILGMAPVSGGFITVDGEIVSPGSASYFREMIAYVPQDLPNDKLKAGELMAAMLNLKVNATAGVDRKSLLGIWEAMGLDEKLMDEDLDNMEPYRRQLVMLSLVPFLKRKIVLIDNAFQTPAVEGFVGSLAAAGMEVVYSCRENKMKCDKLVKL